MENNKKEFVIEMPQVESTSIDITYINSMQQTEEFINDMKRYNQEIYGETD